MQKGGAREKFSKNENTVVPLDAKKRPFSAALNGRKIIEFNAIKIQSYLIRAGWDWNPDFMHLMTNEKVIKRGVGWLRFGLFSTQ